MLFPQLPSFSPSQSRTYRNNLRLEHTLISRKHRNIEAKVTNVETFRVPVLCENQEKENKKIEVKKVIYYFDNERATSPNIPTNKRNSIIKGTQERVPFLWSHYEKRIRA